jgi:thiol-disulfide isomerase/thioredoxin
MEVFMVRRLLVASLVLGLLAPVASAADLVRVVRLKLSAGDLASGIAAVSDYRRETGVDAEYLNAIGWLARGAEMLRQPELAQRYVAELHREIPSEKEELLTPYGAAIEVEAKLIAARDGRGAAVRFLEAQLARAKATSLQSRISKNINLLSLEGQPAPAIDGTDFVGTKPVALSALKGKPVLLFFWANWCGDCAAQSASLSRIREKYADRIHVLGATRYYGTVDDKPATKTEEKAQAAKVWAETYPKLAGVPVAISDEAMVRYGVSATPTLALIDRNGIVRYYTPTRVSEEELSRRIDDLLAD